jgi:hypothetical protein
MTRRPITTFLLLLSLAGIAGCGGGPEPVEDVFAAHPDLASLIFENDYVRVAEFTLEPGDALPLHHGGKRVVYAMSDYTLEWSEGEAEPTSKKWRSSAVHFHDAIAHAAKNTGNTVAHYLVVSRKQVPIPIIEAYDKDRDAGTVDADHSEVILDNDHVRVIEVQIPPGDKQPTHHGLNRVIYALSDYSITYTSDRTGTKESDVEAGEAHWHGRDAHAVENTGETEAHYLIFAWKN